MRLAILLALVATSAHADLTFKTDQFSVSLFEQKCIAPKVLSILRDEWAPKFKQGALVYQGRPLQMCWMESRPGYVVIVDEEGDAAEIPLTQFKNTGA